MLVRITETFYGKEFADIKKFIAGEEVEIADESLIDVIIRGELATEVIAKGSKKVEATPAETETAEAATKKTGK